MLNPKIKHIWKHEEVTAQMCLIPIVFHYSTTFFVVTDEPFSTFIIIFSHNIKVFQISMWYIPFASIVFY